MPITSALCLAQENAQRARARDASLEKVREAATKAADAWRKEGASALMREQRDRARLNRAAFTQAVLEREQGS